MTTNSGGYKCLCPACGSRMRIRNSETQTPTFKTMYAQCCNLACGATYTGSLTWDYALSPSGLDKPRISLPIAPSVQRMQALRDCKPKTNQLDLLDAMGATA
ncbi:ogr/Delta-like zinc finger family protein [Pseudomonas sp. zfem001]|uniref:ogr/Delta-like zinc finger family protein n=1 Tax=Pseudomonas sp. zfem001 TaxID=3078196 RepID=UPI002927FBDF|nr:ogr/Delta-like zinc finger family protein [Pseudomonas sp. zfem001]MDU9408247.1 ogr/Delta-like zinc finger family protein [Pseudomonas sp. zfem001]